MNKKMYVLTILNRGNIHIGPFASYLDAYNWKKKNDIDFSWRFQISCICSPKDYKEKTEQVKMC